ncbi:MAG: acyl-CoA dehydrogenase family protein [Halioglobus sp.]|nr:acyl-CoA dehydrogenase family protein [Halioglobus sp.]
MDFSLSSEQKALADSVARFARSELNHDVQSRDRDGRFPHDLWLKCGELGLLGLPVDASHGGSGLDALSTCIALEALGRGCRDSGLNFSICAHLLACVVPVWKHGSEQLKAKYLRQLCSGKLIAVNAMTEAHTGSDPFSMLSRAVPENGGFRINGTKTFSTNGPIADVAVFYAMTDRDKGYHGGVTSFLVDRHEHGFACGQKFAKMGLRTSPICELVFDDVWVPAANVIGHVGGGAGIFTESMEWERICLVACHLGVMQRLLEAAVGYARERRQGGQIIGKHQAVANRIANMKVRLEASRLLVYQAANKLGKKRSVGMDAAITKLFVSEALVETAQDALRTFGGYGFMEEYDVERAVRDAMGSVLYSGTSDLQRNIVASWLGL